MKLSKPLIFLRSKILRNTIIGLFLFYILFGFFVVPLIIKSKAEKIVMENYKEVLLVEKITFNPFSFELNVLNLTLPDTNTGGADKHRLKFDRLQVNLEIFPLIQKKITLSNVSIVGAHIYLSFYKNKKNNWSSFIKDRPLKKKGFKNKSKWILVLEKISFDRDYLQFRDFNYLQAVDLPLGPLNLKARNISTSLGPESSLDSLFINLEENGTLQLQGKGRISPPSADIKIIAHKIPLDFLSAYLSTTTYIEINKGQMDFDGDCSYHDAVLKMNGNARIYDFLLRRTVDQSNILKIGNAEFKKISYSTIPNSFTLELASFSDISTHVVLKPDGTLNFENLTRTSPDNALKKTTPITYEIGSIEIINSQLDYSDLQIRPNFLAHVHDLNGSFGPVSNNANNKIEIKLGGKVEEHGEFTSSGFYFQNKKPMELNLDVKFANVEMTTFTPYSGHFAGYEIQKGKLFLDLNYKLSNNRIRGKNNVRLDNFSLGEKVKSKNAVKWPLKLALAVLKDRKGQIKFFLPVAGDTNSPNFSYFKAIKTALSDMLVKIVSTPFDYLSGLVGGGKELQLVEFENRTTVFKPENEIKLDKIVKIMEERPELRIEVIGTCSEKEFMTEDKNKRPVVEEAKYKEIGLQRAKLIQSLLVKKNINPKRVFVLDGKKNDDSKGRSGAVLRLKED